VAQNKERRIVTKPVVGLLPLYIELYDKSWPELRARVDGFYQQIAAALRDHGLEVETVPICRVKPEFESAIRQFESQPVDAIVTLHLAYSPSLESSALLASTPLPIVVLDTTPTYSYGPGQDPQELLYNHGIHGVQDMCNLLRRNQKAYEVVAGHWQKSDVLERVATFARAARLAGALKRARVGQVGPAFAGMGDFAVPPAKLRETLGIETIQADPSLIRSLLTEVSDAAVDAEMAYDREHFLIKDLNPEVHRQSTRAGLAIRRWLERERLTAFTVNFLSVDKASGLPSMPFLEASKAMARGLGYAGEGDVLTAALVGALASVYPPTSFTETFCPDWEGDRIFLSHMGEMNINLTADRPSLVEKPFPFTDVGNPVVAVGRFRPGDAVLVNLAPGAGDQYSLIAAPIVMQDVEGADRMAETIHGWFKASLPVGDFLAEYSRAGGTHHCALVYGKVADSIASWGRLMRWNKVLIQ
jgi:L-arabinose isomerase